MAKLNRNGIGNFWFSIFFLALMILGIVLCYIFIESGVKLVVISLDVTIFGLLMIATWIDNFFKQFSEFLDRTITKFKKTYLERE